MKHIFKIVLSAFMMCFLGASELEAQLVVTPANEISGWSADSLVRNVLLSGGVSVSHVMFNGYSDDLQCDNIGTFRTGSTPTNIGIERGLIIGTGNVSVAVGPNDDDMAHIETNCSGNSDASLNGLATNVTYDAAVLEFDFVPWDSVVSFNYVFGSEEYPEFVFMDYNDVFGFFVTGANPMGGNYNNTNMALIPSTLEVVSIDNVNDQHNAEYYISNSGGTTIQYDGFTTIMNVNFRVVPMTQYHIKMAICNVGDDLVDSGVFLQANSFESPLSYAMLIEDMLYLEIPADYYFCANRTINFDTETNWNYDNVKWYFGDGASAYGRSVQHTYAQDGSYEVMNVLYNPHRATDSIYLTKVIEVRSHEGSEEATTCAGVPYTWHGQQYTEPGDYTDMIEAPDGCDSIVTLHLTIGSVITADTVAQTCHPFTWYGHTYEASGEYEHLLHTDMGCDSLVTLHLTVAQAVETDTVVGVCESFTWYGHTYQTSGEYQQVFHTDMGCDSIITLHLTVGQIVGSDTVVNSCGDYEWYGQNYTATGLYEQVFHTDMGCDSVIRLHLTVNETQHSMLYGPTHVSAASDMIEGVYGYYVPDSLGIAPHTLNWTCSNTEWVITPNNSRYRCMVSITNVGYGTLTARTDHDCDTIYSIDISATWFDVEENEGARVKMYPNPANTSVTVEGDDIAGIRMMDAFGMVVMEKAFDPTEVVVLDISAVPQGVYVVDITTRRGEIKRRLVVAR